MLARDRMGVKPLYWAETPNGLAFASEVKSLIAGGLVEPELDPLAAELFLAHGFVPGPRTPVRGRAQARRRPRCWSARTAGVADERAYWTPYGTRGAAEPGASWEEHQEELLELLREAVRRAHGRRRPARGHAQRRPRLEPDHRVDGRALERPGQDLLDRVRRGRAARTSSRTRAAWPSRLGTDHHELTTSAVDHPDLLDEALWHLEEPVADVSCLGLPAAQPARARDVTVALSGQGADELLGGYRKHEIAALAAAAQRLHRALARAAGRAAALARRPNGSTLARGIARRDRGRSGRSACSR